MQPFNLRVGFRLVTLVLAGLFLAAACLAAVYFIGQQVLPSQDASAAAPQGLTRYVAKNGSDAGPNNCLNPGAPCLTVSHAISRGGSNDSILAAQGVYTENIVLDKPLTLLGGYESSGWTRDIALYETILDGSNSRDVVGDWDGMTVMVPTVISETAGFKMWYTGYEQIYPWIRRAGLAESIDGESWSKYGGNPLFDSGSSWDQRARIPASVLYDNGQYKMWYSGWGSDSTRQIGYATSSDGINWNFYAGNPVLAIGAPGAWDELMVVQPGIIKDAATYKMWYTGCRSDRTCSIGYATSPNGLNWTKYAGNPVLTGTPGGWDENMYSRPTVIKNGASYTPGPPVDGADLSNGTARLLLLPDRAAISPGQEFTVRVLAQAGSQKLDGAAVHLDFDPAAVQVMGMTGNPAAFPKELLNRFDNHLGRIDYAAGAFGSFPKGDIEVFSVRFQAMPGAAGARPSFVFELPRRTDATYGGESVLGAAEEIGLSFGPLQNKLLLPLVLK